MLKQRGEAKVGTVVGLTGVSGGGTFVSFFADTLPVIQWCGAAIGVLSGMLALVLGVLKIVEWFEKRSGRVP